MTIFVGGVADGKNIDVPKVNGRPIEEVRIAHFEVPPVELAMQYDGPMMPKTSADVYRFCSCCGTYRYDRTVEV